MLCTVNELLLSPAFLLTNFTGRTRDLKANTFQTLTGYDFALSASIWLKFKICAVT